MNESDLPPSAVPWKGVFIGKGTRVTIPAGGLVIGFDDNGQFTSECTLHIGLNLCRHWLRIACNHLFEAEDAHQLLIKANADSENEKISECLEKEFEAGMQAVMAAAIAIDSYYAAVKEYYEISDDLTKLWRDNRTARHKQINEVFRRAFPILRKPNHNLHIALKEIFRFRDLAVHPKSGVSDPLPYPELNLSVEWRYAAFRFENAKKAVLMTLQIVDLTTIEPYPENEKLKEYCIAVRDNFKEVIDLWGSRYGDLPNAKKASKND